jgi:pimeloyl-ACP methyl ester carboxylesterase
MYFSDFGFKLSDIKQPVHFWWGTEDNAVIKMHAESVEKQVPNLVLHYKQNEGHLFIYINYFEEVFDTIAGNFSECPSL